MEQQITIERVNVAEVKKLQEIGRFTFFEAFAEVNTEQNMSNYLENHFSEEQLENELNNRDSQFYFARVKEKVIAYLKINLGEAQNEKIDDALEIERIYVLKAFHGKGVAQALYQKAIDIAHQMQLGKVWLGVWEENYRALRFYEKNGFTAFGKHAFWLGDDEQTDLLMKKELASTNELKTH
ncbi:GNAT family N-acetyltransferase [Pedobacter zeae]|uniref:N-acetyltransferase n=1 Tax=Pedobacter zeae TaxID=1737356 RepID=A0A7W6KAT7_9SPHI|nr:GNAT family N-acetyltransferase [Pedobacter zeae]MBB4108375.1 ribosomal protein S18 acetylase RimI-like enzyme [Pedobacter zeae]GGG93200.1 N-acetyltransferase [Pedobacter zeae]